MSRVGGKNPLMPSIIDRLIDPESRGGYDVREMTDAVRRDLENLLNTRQTIDNLGPEFEEVRNSVLAYGLPDLNSLNAITAHQREEIGGHIERIVQLFEPRLKDVKTVLVDAGARDGAGNNIGRTVKFHINAKLNVDPSPEVAFDTILELTTGHYKVDPLTK